MISSSVIIPAYNCAALLPACLESVLDQTIAPLEIIVVDDKSTDNTQNVAKSFKNVRLISRPERGGAGAARASGVMQAKGDVVAFIDSDCIAPEDWLERILKKMQNDPKLGAVGGMYRHCHSKSLISIFGKFEEEFLHHNFALTPENSTLSGGNMAVRRTVWSEARSGRELIHFQQVASSEDTVVANEIRAVSKTFFTTDIFVSHMPKDDFYGFFRRNILRAQTRMTCNLLRLSKTGDNLFPAFGGFRLFWAAAALWFTLPVSVLMAFFPEHLLSGAPTIILMLIAHYFLSLPFFKFIKSNDNRPCPVQVETLHYIGLRLLVCARAACWVLGSFLGIGQYIFNRTRFYSKIILSIFHFWWPGRLSKMFYFVTSKCNARCEFCFNLDNVINWKERAKTELSLVEVQKLTKNLKRLPYLTFSGGEPFARKDLSSVVRAFYGNCNTMWVTIPTNGALTKNIVEGVFDILTTCPDIFLTIQFSVDALHEAHDTSRKINGGFEAMLKTAKRLSFLRRHYDNLRVQINTPYDTFNVHEIEKIRDFCRENFDFDQQLFYMFREEDTLISNKNVALADGFLDFIKNHDLEEWKRKGRNLWGLAVSALQTITYEDTKRIKKDKEFIRPCNATRAFATLYDDGVFTPCEVLSSTHLGNIRDFDYDYYKMKSKMNINHFHKEKIIDTKCNCEWMCAPPINMLYHPPSWFRIVGSLFRTFKSNLHVPSK